MRRRNAFLLAGCAVLAGFLAACAADSSGDARTRGGADGASGAGFGNARGGAGGSGSFANSGGSGGATAAGGSTGTLGGGQDGCPRVDAAVQRRIPRVTLVVDGSGSMNDDFGAGTRWTELRAALLDPAMGLVPQLESTVEFGLTIYSREDPSTCPSLIEAEMAIDNFATLDAQYPQEEPGGGTPTGEALATVVAGLPDVSSPPPDSEIVPHIIILSTDGMPNGCGEPPDASICPDVPPLLPGFPAGPDPFCVANYFQNLPPDYQGTVDATYAAQAKGIQLYVVSLAPGMQQQSELQRVANIGLGMDENASPGAPIFEPTDPGALRDTLLGIIGGAVGCTLQLSGSLNVGRACEGTVQLNGHDIGCEDADGWRAVDGGHIELLGESCRTFQGDPTVTLNAHWPCGVIVE